MSNCNCGKYIKPILNLEIAKLTAENVDLLWFSSRVNEYVMPGETDTKDAAFILFKKLTAENEALRKSLEFIGHECMHSEDDCPSRYAMQEEARKALDKESP